MAKTIGSIRGGKGVRAALLRSEKNIKMNSFETAILYNNKGKIFQKKGESRQVAFSAKEAALMRDGVLTHNHPSTRNATGVLRLGTSFSKDDITTAVVTNLKEIRAVTPHGYTYSLRRPPKGWGVSRRKIISDYKNIERRVRIKLTGYVMNGGNPERANIIHVHSIVRELANKYGWIYSRSK